MRKIYIYLFAILMSACTLTTEPTDMYTQINFWKTAEQYEAGLTACYSSLRNGYVYGNANSIFSEVCTPNAFIRTEHFGWMALSDGTNDNNNCVISNYRWGGCYEGIGRCNTYIDNAGSAPFVEPISQRMKAEAKFLRALFYSILIQHYGDVPLIIETPNITTQTTLPRTPKAEVLSQIIQDYKEAAENLPLSYGQGSVGRATKGAAYAMLGRIYLYNNMWAEAAEMMKKVIDLNQYSLFNDYKKLFLAANENNGEVIFDVQFLNNPGTMQNTFDIVLRSYDTCAPTLDLVNCYQNSDGSFYNSSNQNFSEKRDPRFYATIAYVGGTYMGKTITSDDARFNATGLKFKKFSKYMDDNITTDSDLNEINYIVIRYADVLLSYAEALNESNPANATEAVKWLNKIRERESVNMPPYTGTYTQTQVRDMVRLERRVELAGEGLYYNDILRWKTAETVNNVPVRKLDGTIIYTRTFDKNKNYLWPVPLRQIEINNNLLPNNSGY